MITDRITKILLQNTQRETKRDTKKRLNGYKVQRLDHKEMLFHFVNLSVLRMTWRAWLLINPLINYQLLVNDSGSEAS